MWLELTAGDERLYDTLMYVKLLESLMPEKIPDLQDPSVCANLWDPPMIAGTSACTDNP